MITHCFLLQVALDYGLNGYSKKHRASQGMTGAPGKMIGHVFKDNIDKSVQSEDIEKNDETNIHWGTI